MKMETQTELLAELEAEIYQNILKLIENNPRINLRNLALLSSCSPQDVWSALVELKERKIVESAIVFNGKSGWKVQYGLRDDFQR